MRSRRVDPWTVALVLAYAAITVALAVWFVAPLLSHYTVTIRPNECVAPMGSHPLKAGR